MTTRRGLKALVSRSSFLKRRLSRKTDKHASTSINLASFPTEVLLLIFQHLTQLDRRINIARTCKRFHDITKSYWPPVRLDQLPYEIIVDIFEYLTYWELKFRIKPVNRRFRDIIGAEVQMEESLRPVSIKRSLCFETAALPGRRHILNPMIPNSESRLFFVYKTSTGECCYSGPWDKATSKNPSVVLETTPLTLPEAIFEPLFYPSITKLAVIVSKLPGTGYEHIQERPRPPWYEDYAQLRRRSQPPPITVLDVADCVAAAMFRSNTGLPDYNVFSLKHRCFESGYYDKSKLQLFVELNYVEGFFLDEYGQRAR